MTDKTEPLMAKTRALTPYVTIWALLGCLALGYLVLALSPQTFMRSMAEQSVPSADDPAETRRTVADLAAEVRALHENVGQVRRELVDLRTETAARAERENEMNMRVATLENTAAAATAAATAPPEAAKVASAAQAAAKKAAAKAEQKTAAQKAPAATAKANGATPPATAIIETQPATPSLETGSVGTKSAATPQDFGPAVVKPAAKPIGLKLGAGPSVDSLRLNWTVLADQNGELGSLKPRYVTGINDQGLTYELIAGPIASTAEAKRICAELVQRGNACKVGEFSGNAL